MMPPQSMPIGFTYEGEPMYAAVPLAAGARQPLAVLPDGEPIWPVQDGVVPAGQPQPFGVLSSGAYVWAVEQTPPKPPAPWYRRRRIVAPAAVLTGLLTAATIAAGSADDGGRDASSGGVLQPTDDQANTNGAAAEPQAGDRAAAEPQAVPEPPGVNFVMPDFAGQNLQLAQNKVQELGVFFSISHDLRGTRAQVLDANWQVCNQTPAPGSSVRGEATDWQGEIDFGVVKVTELCP